MHLRTPIGRGDPPIEAPQATGGCLVQRGASSAPGEWERRAFRATAKLRGFHLPPAELNLGHFRARRMTSSPSFDRRDGSGQFWTVFWPALLPEARSHDRPSRWNRELKGCDDGALPRSAAWQHKKTDGSVSRGRAGRMDARRTDEVLRRVSKEASLEGAAVVPSPASSLAGPLRRSSRGKKANDRSPSRSVARSASRAVGAGAPKSNRLALGKPLPTSRLRHPPTPPEQEEQEGQKRVELGRNRCTLEPVRGGRWQKGKRAEEERRRRFCFGTPLPNLPIFLLLLLDMDDRFTSPRPYRNVLRNSLPGRGGRTTDLILLRARPS